jgi:dsRNA-specific ribonuclease
MRLADYILSTRKSEGASDKLLADTFEALLGVIYLERGLECAHRFIGRYVEPICNQTIRNQWYLPPRARLQALAYQKMSGHAKVRFRVVSKPSPKEQRGKWVVVCQLGQKKVSQAEGRNKKEAEENATCEALAKEFGIPYAPFHLRF